MRDYVVTAFILGSLPFILKRPWIGALMWVWIGVMNPHRLTWDFAYGIQFAFFVAIATFAGLLFWKGHKHLPWTPVTITLGLLFAWMHVTLLLAGDFQASLPMYDKVFKIFLMLFVVLYLLHSKQHIQWLMFILTVSIAYYGVKGGRFTLLGGGERVWGPGGSFIEDNNALAVAVIMTIPLVRYWQLQLKKTWQKLALVPVMVLCAISALGSQSRGALLAIVAMTALLWLKGRNKFFMLVLIVVTAPVIYNFMPQTWHTRMSTIETYDEDASAMGRLDAWQGAIRMANHRPFGGGFGIYNLELLGQYTPSGGVRAMHSIWFQILGEHGWVGLALFVLMWVLVWRDATWIIRRCGKREEFSWAADLARMTQVSLIGFFVGGALLQLAYWDVPYYLLIALVLTRRLVEQQTEDTQQGWHPSANRARAVPAAAASTASPPAATPARQTGRAVLGGMPGSWQPPKSG